MASYQISAPEPFVFANTEEWPRWVRRFERFRESSELSQKSEENQISTFIYTMGDAAEDIFESLEWEDQEQKTYENVKQKFENYFSKKKNVIYKQAKFNERKQKEALDKKPTILKIWLIGNEQDS